VTKIGFGFVLVDKPWGPTSHDVVDVVRKALGIRRVGHAGTLDPPASGLVVVGVGPATRLLRYVQDLRKTYEVTAALGVRTTTLDATGEVVSSEAVHVAPDEIRDAAVEFVGEISQRPPDVSAVKVGGERAYRKARRGEAVEIAPRRVTIHSFDVLRTSPDAFDARVVCSSGTYVRSLVADVGERLGCGAHVAALRRTKIGHLEVANAVPPDEIGPQHVVGIESVLSHIPTFAVDAESAFRARNGRSLEANGITGPRLIVGPDEAVVGVFVPHDGILRPETVVAT
jgi:tRNA pseudouridine55 synthase